MASASTMERWFFYQDAANLWKWARLDVFGTVLSYSAAAFGSRGECVEDARRCGYREPSSPAVDFTAVSSDHVGQTPAASASL